MTKKFGKIKDKSRTYQKVRPSKIAKALGASIVVGETKSDELGKEYFKITWLSDEPKEKRVYRLFHADIISKGYRCIGEVEGQNFIQCIYLGGKNTDKFYERVVGFTVSNPRLRGMKIHVAFYEERSHPSA